MGDKGWGKYYHFTYGTFPPGTKVPTFMRQLDSEESAALAAANKILENCGVDPAGKRYREETSTMSVAVEPGKTAKVLELRGSQAITAIRMKLDVPPAPKDYDLLRTLALRIAWDGQGTPAISPLWAVYPM